MEFTVNIVPPRMKEVVHHCGTVSGREHNKFLEKQLTALPSKNVTPPFIKESLLHFECKVVHKSDMIPSALAKAILSQFYPKQDLHRVYMGEILVCQAES